MYSNIPDTSGGGAASRPKFPDKDSTNKGDWAFALETFFAVGRGVPRDWWNFLSLEQLSGRANLLREILRAPSNGQITSLLNAHEPRLQLRIDARVVHTGNFLFILQDTNKFDVSEVVVMNWTQPTDGAFYIERENFKSSSFVPNTENRVSGCRLSLTPIEETFGMAVRATCNDSSDRPTFVSVIAVTAAIGAMAITVHGNCEGGLVAGSYMNHAPRRNVSIVATNGFPYTSTVFFLFRDRKGMQAVLRFAENDVNEDLWRGRKTARRATLENGAFLLGVDNSSKSTAVFQVDAVGGAFGIYEVPIFDDGSTPAPLICKMDLDVLDMLNRHRDGAQYVLIDSSFDHIDNILYVAYEDRRPQATIINVRAIPRKSSTPPDFFDTKVVFSRIKPARSQYSYSFRLGNEFVIAEQGKGYETIPLSERPPSAPRSVTLYSSTRVDLEKVYVVPRENNGSFSVFVSRFAIDDDDN